MSGFSFGSALVPWTPTLIGSATPGTGQTYSAQSGSGEMIAPRLVLVRFSVIATSLGTAAGNILIGGLPFTNTAGELGHVFIDNFQVTGLAASNFGVGGYILGGTSQINVVQNGNASSTSVTIAQAGGTCFFQGTAIYRQ